MTRAALSVVPFPDPYSLTGDVRAPVAADAGGNLFIATGADVIVAYNSDTNPHTITITSSADKYGRTASKTVSIPAGQIWTSGVLPKAGYLQAGGYIYIDVATSVKLLVYSL